MMLKSKHYWKIVLLWMLFLIAASTFVYLPWFDEVFMSNISSSFLREGKLYLSLAVDGDKNEILEYGPVTFWIQSAFFYLFGESFWVGRLVNIVFGFALFFIIYRWIKKNMTIPPARLILLLLVTDMAILTSLLCGRLDFISIFLFCAGLFIFIKKRDYGSLILSGLLFALAFLSTPRIGIYLVAFVPFFVLEATSQKKLIKNIIDYGIIFIAFLIPVATWIFTKFGSLDAYIKRYTGNPLIVEHVGGTSFIPKVYQIVPLLLIAAALVYRWENKIRIPNYVWLFIGIIVLHMAFIKEIGPYSGMMMPFVYMVLVVLIDKSLVEKFIALRLGISVYLLAMLGVFMIKAIVMTVTLPQRYPTHYQVSLAEKLDSSKPRILADYKFYYLLKNMNADFKSFDYNLKKLNPRQLRSFDYIIVDGAGLKRLKKQFPTATLNEVKIDDSGKKVRIPSFLKGFDNDYNGFIVTFADTK